MTERGGFFLPQRARIKPEGSDCPGPRGAVRESFRNFLTGWALDGVTWLHYDKNGFVVFPFAQEVFAGWGWSGGSSSGRTGTGGTAEAGPGQAPAKGAEPGQTYPSVPGARAEFLQPPRLSAPSSTILMLR